MKASPLHYQGIVRDEEDDAGNSTHAGGAYAEPNVTKGRPASSTESTTAARGGLLNTLLVLILVIVSIISVVYIEDISQSVRDLNWNEPKGFSSSTLQSLQTSTTAYSDSPTLYSDHGNSLYIRIPAAIIDSNTDILLIEQLTSGMGSRDLFWDAGTVVSQDIVQFRYAGVGNLELIHMQQSYRGDQDLMQRSFPNSVLWSFDILDSNDAGVLIQLDQFALSGIGSLHGNDIPTALAATYGTQYVYTVDAARSRLNTQTSGSNDFRTVIDRSITYAHSSAALLPPPSAVDRQFTLTARRSFILLDTYYRLQAEHAGQWHYESYRPRPFHPMSGLNALSFMNEDAGLLESRQQLYTIRHRLFNNSISTAAASAHVTEPMPAAALSPTARGDVGERVSSASATAIPRASASPADADVPAHAQLVYYIDAATPPGIREALVDGVNWWDTAFQAAGYAPGTFYATVIDRKTFDPYDVHVPKRNFVEWIDRDLRSYSVGVRVADPRTGEILKGHVRIENLRMRQDALIAEALLGPFTDVSGSASSGGRSSLLRALQNVVEQGEGAVLRPEGHSGVLDTAQSNILRVIMQRVRQLGAHEVGHTLGLAHNFAGSTSTAGYASVMDYPPPIVTLDATHTKLVLNTKAYSTGIGAFDKISIRYGYKQLGNISLSQERAALDELLQQAITQDGYVFLTDQDAAATSGDWRDTQWDAGNDPITALNTSLAVRALAMQKLQSTSALAAYTPYSQLQELLPIVYLWHRYEVEAAAKLVGGYTFQYDVRSGAASTLQGVLKPVPAEKQLAALRQLLAALHPSQLAAASNLTQHLLPTAFGYSPDIGGVGDLLPTRTGTGTFDIMAASEVGANLVISAIFTAPRLERIAAQVLKDGTLPSLRQVLDLCSNTVFGVDFAVSAFRSAGKGESGLAALLAVQTALVNAYLTILTDATAAHSFAIRRALSYHLLTVTNLLYDSSFNGVNLCAVGNVADELCGELGNELNIHYLGLRNAITAGKPITDTLKPPLGPPM